MLQFLKNSRIVLILCGLIMFVGVCFTFSFQSAKISQISCCLAYFIAGSFLFKNSLNKYSIILLFLPHLIPAFLLFSNPGLFPDVFPFILISAIISFYFGHQLKLNYKATKIFILILTGFFAYMTFIALYLTPKILLLKFQSNQNQDIVLNENFTFYDQKSNVVKLKGEGLEILNFWFVGCGVCYPHSDMMNEIAGQYENQKVKFYLIDMGNIDSFDKFLNLKSRWPNLTYLYDSAGVITSKLNINGAPHTIMFKEGKVIHEHSGFSNDIDKLLNDQLIELIDENLPKR